MLADCTSHSAALPRLGLLDDLTFSYYPLLRSRWRLCRLTDAVHSLQSPSTSDLHKLAIACQGGIAVLAAVRITKTICIADSR